MVRDAELGRRLVDKLVRLWRLEGEEAWVMIHIEVQGQVEEGFAKRMYIYHYRLAGIELGLELRFGDEGSRLLPEIRQIEEVEVLRAIHAGLKRARAPCA